MIFMGTETHQDGHWHTDGLAHAMDWGLLAGDGEEGALAREGVAAIAAANCARRSHPVEPGIHCSPHHRLPCD
jgi:hypothetical protein